MKVQWQVTAILISIEIDKTTRIKIYDFLNQYTAALLDYSLTSREHDQSGMSGEERS
jgi:hypothetical protein